LAGRTDVREHEAGTGEGKAKRECEDQGKADSTNWNNQFLVYLLNGLCGAENSVIAP
jgi:hypothetical protein